MVKFEKRIRVFYAALIILMVCSSCNTREESPVQVVNYVDPLIGSGGHGHVFVGANVPFGAVQVGPNNIYKGWDWCSGYHYSDSLIIGFSQLHLSGTGIGDLADILIMPYTGEARLDKGKQEYPHGGYLSTFSHENEIARPGYYSLKMDNGVEVELAATERVGFHRYRFPVDQKAHIIIDLKEGINDRTTETSLEQRDNYTLLGRRFSSGWAKEQQVFFAIRSSVPLQNLSLFENQDPLEGIQAEGIAIKGLISFDQAPEKVELKVGISPVSEENALANIEAEIPDWDFDKVVADAREKWNSELSKISIESSNDSDKRIFYTSLYHAYMHPSLFNDHNGDYRGADNEVYNTPDFDNYTILSTWDTYRAAHPLFTITQPHRVNDIVNTMLAIYDQQGYLPIWHLHGYETKTMVGISSMQIIAEAYLKGLRGFDAERAYEAVKTTSMLDMEGLNFLREFRPIPNDLELHRTVAQAMELCIADGSIALMAKAMGKDEDYEYFSKRALNYQLYYDRSVEFFRGLDSEGNWNPIFDPLASDRVIAKDYAEGNAWQYLWLAPQDVSGLVELMGGRDRFISRLDSFFVLESADESEVLVDLTGLIGQYAHGNEPSHHIAYLYASVGQQWKTAEHVRYIMKEFYHDDPDGVIGNEDAGQMSAWYVLSSLGFYPVFPASTEYVFGSPLFDKVTIDLPEGRTFTIEAVNNSPENIYIQAVELNGKEHKEMSISHQDIMKGGNLKFVMGNSADDTSLVKGEQPLKVLVITGNHEYNQPAFDAMIHAFKGMDCTIKEMGDSPGKLFEQTENFPYDAIVMYNFRQEISTGQQEQFKEILRSGVGLTVIHHALAGFPGWTEYEDIIGATYVLEEESRGDMHYPRPTWKHGVDMKIYVEDAKHPITKGLSDFLIHDESYKGWIYHKGNHLLLSTDHISSNHQISWTRTWEASRVFCIQLGHDEHAFGNENYRKLLKQGILWSTKRAVEDKGLILRQN